MESRKFLKSKENIPDKKRASSETQIPRMRSFSTDRQSIRKSNVKFTGHKLSNAHCIPPATGSPVKTSTSSTSGKDGMNKGCYTPKAGNTIRASSAERASVLAPKGLKKDNRPLNDKSYQNEMLQKVDGFFHSINQTCILNSTGSIKPFSLKIFVDATNLIVKLIDMKLSLNLSNYIEEVPKIAKKLHYPGLVNKSWLKTANAIHSWPHAIGWICWLVELCEVKDVATEIFIASNLPMISEDANEREKYRNVFLTMVRCYQAWNEEKPDEENLLMRQFLEVEAQRRGIKKHKLIASDLEQAERNYFLEQRKLDDMNKNIYNEEEINSNLSKDYAKLVEKVKSQEKYLEKSSKDVDQLNKDYSKFENNVKKLEETKNELSSVIRKQPMSIGERDEIVKNCSEQQNYLQNFETHLEEIRRESYSLDMKLAFSNKNLVKTILEYNKALFIQFSGSAINVNNLLMPEVGQCESSFIEKLEEKVSLMSKLVEKHKALLNKNATSLESQKKTLEALYTKKDTLSEKAKKKTESEEKRRKHFKGLENTKQEEIKRLDCDGESLHESIQNILKQQEFTNEQIQSASHARKILFGKLSKMRNTSASFFENVERTLNAHGEKLIQILKHGKP